MNNKHINKITAVTRVYPEGQKCAGAVVEYDIALAAKSVFADAFTVDGRRVVNAFAAPSFDGKCKDGRFVIIELSGDDANAATYAPGDPWINQDAKVWQPELVVSQVKPLCDVKGEPVPAAAGDKNTAVKNLLVDEFIHASFEGLAYNLFVPRNYDKNKKYPLVQFIHDAAVCSEQAECTLAQGVGALVWMTEEAQKKQECFVLAPQYAPPSIVDDDWNVDPRLETGKRLLDWIVAEYSIDTDRIYTTGQSMGCMSSMVLNLRYPDLFAASLFVAGQWDERQFTGANLHKKKFWFINSQGDAKAFPGMNQITYVLEKEGAKIAREVWDAKGRQEEHAASAAQMISTGANMFYTPYEITSIADGWSSHGGEHHITTWQYAYNEEAVREWLFAQKKEKRADNTGTKSIDWSCKHGILIQNADGTYNHMDEPFYEAEEIRPGVWKILSSGDYSYLIAGETEGIAIDSGYGAGNIREYMEKLCGLPVPRIINTHHHFDHTANNGYFQQALMHPNAIPLATVPFASFAGVEFITDYERVPLKEWETIDLGNKKLTIIYVPDHTEDGIAIFDPADRLMFTGDEYMPFGKMLSHATLTQFFSNTKKLTDRAEDFDYICGGGGLFPTSFLWKFYRAAEYILDGHQGEDFIKDPNDGPQPMPPGPNGELVYDRMRPHFGDGGAGKVGMGNNQNCKLEYEGILLVYDKNRL